MVDSKSKNIPASILRKPIIMSTNDNESSEDLLSDENQFLIHSDDSENDDSNCNGSSSTRRSSCDIVRETILDDGRKEILYSNGNLKKISPDGTNIKVIYYNGDVKETKEDSERYYFANNKTYHTTFNTGLEIIEFPK
jgi:centromere protein J